MAAAATDSGSMVVSSTPADAVAAVFSGLPDKEISRLAELADRDPVAGVLEFNEQVLAVGASDSKTCLMTLRHNSTMDPMKLSETFREQVRAEYTSSERIL